MAPRKSRVKQGRRTAAVKERETFRKRRWGLVKKAHELACFTAADLYLLISHGGRFYVYSSRDGESWPPSRDTIALHHPATEWKSRADFDDVAFPSRRRHVDRGRGHEAQRPFEDIRQIQSDSGKEESALDLNGGIRPALDTLVQDALVQETLAQRLNVDHKDAGHKRRLILPSVPELPQFLLA